MKNEEGRRRAASAVASAMASRGWNAVDLADAAEVPDPATIRTFLDGSSWPWGSTRSRIERALGLEPGQIEAIAKGRAPVAVAVETDPVVDAIRRSDLPRAAKAELEMHYYRLVDGESGVG